MTVFLRVSIVAACLAASTPSAFAAYGECYVDDPTGTPLNVRTAPNGAILTTLANGTQVEVVDEMRIGKKQWLFVSRQGDRLGWIFGAYVVCRQPGGTREAEPGQPAEQR